MYNINDDTLFEICSHLSVRDFIQFTITCRKSLTKTKIKKINEPININIIKQYYHKYNFTNLLFDDRCQELDNDDFVYNIPNSITELDLRLHHKSLRNINLNQLSNINSIRISSSSIKGSVLEKDLTFLPSNLKYITFCNILFRNNIQNLPNKLIKFKIDRCRFDQQLNFLPPTLKVLVIDSSIFDQPLNNLPNTLEELVIISPIFNQVIDFPQTLKKLVIDSPIFNKPLNNLPLTVIKLKILSYTNLIKKNGSGNENILIQPNILKKMCITYDYPLANLPQSLTNLTLKCYGYNHQLPQLPDSLKILDIYNYNQPIHCNSLKKISTNTSFKILKSRNIITYFPNLEEIIFNNDFPLETGNGFYVDNNFDRNIPFQCFKNISHIKKQINEICTFAPVVKQVVFHFQCSTINISVSNKNIQKIVVNYIPVYHRNIVIMIKIFALFILLLLFILYLLY